MEKDKILIKFSVENALSQGTDATGPIKSSLAIVVKSGKRVWLQRIVRT